MKKNSKAIIICLVLFLTSCEWHRVGGIVVYPSSIGDIGRFSYEIYNDRMIIKGMVMEELFVGEYYKFNPITALINLIRPNKNAPRGYRRVILRGAWNNFIECFIQNSSFRNIEGSHGRCYYLRTGEEFRFKFLEK